MLVCLLACLLGILRGKNNKISNGTVRHKVEGGEYILIDSKVISYSLVGRLVGFLVGGSVGQAHHFIPQLERVLQLLFDVPQPFFPPLRHASFQELLRDQLFVGGERPL